MTDMVLQRLKEIRTRTDLKLKTTKHLRTTFTGFDGSEKPLSIRYYQVQMILHLLIRKRFVIGDDTGCGKCQPYSSLILTDKGLLRIGEIEDWSKMSPGEFKPAIRGTRVLIGGRSSPIKNYYYGGVKPTITVRTRYGFQNTGTLIHPMLVLRQGTHEWVKAQDIQEGDFLCVERRYAEFPEQEPLLNKTPGALQEYMSPELARFLGYYIGEGSLTHTAAVILSQSPEVNPEIHADIVRLFALLEGRAPKVRGPDIRANKTSLRRWLAANGLGYTLSKEREVPRCILQATEESSREFLRALFEGEAHAAKTHIEYSTASEELGRQVQIMLLRFGVVSNRSPKRVKGRDHTYWRLSICGENAAIFQQRVGFISSRKQEALRACLARPRNTNHDVVPGVSEVFEEVRSSLKRAAIRAGANGVRKGSGLKQFGTSFINTLNNIRNYGRNPSYSFIEKTVGLLQEHAPNSGSLSTLEGFLKTRYFYDPVVSLEEGEEEVFDIEVDDPSHCFVGNGLVNHNTLEVIGALCYVWANEPERKAIVLTTKSGAPQWEGEFEKFTVGVTPFLCQGTKKKRDKIRDAFLAHHEGPAVLIMGYRTAVQDFRHLQDLEGHILISDECTAFKNPKTQVAQVCRHLSMYADRSWGATATLIKNELLEGYGIYQVILPAVFSVEERPMSITQFMYYFGIVEMIPIPRSNRKVPKVVGYTQEKVREFRELIAPYYLGRPKHEVATELPVLTMRTIEVGMSKEQEAKYKEALGGLLLVGEMSGEEEEKEVTKLTALIYCQQIVDDLALIDCEGESEKLKALVELLSNGDMATEKVVIFSRFKSMVDIIVPTLEKAGRTVVRVTGDESGADRRVSQKRFQDPKGADTICITMAGAESLNLQMGKALIFYDQPWSAGDYLQILGRIIRIGSPHDRCFAIHLLAGKLTIDHRVMKTLTKKLHLIEAVLGKRLKGESEGAEFFSVKSDQEELFEMLRQDAQEVSGKKKGKEEEPGAPPPKAKEPPKEKPKGSTGYIHPDEEINLDDLWD